jgi:thiosulfate dehydrogenase [quinone] large subunit
MNTKKTTVWLFTGLRVFIGWHFLFEGISKLFDPSWSATSYLMESKWLMSGFFHWLIGNSTTLKIVDFMNIWGLIIIGICLFIGAFTRLASIAGVLLLTLYYFASPPFVASSMPTVSHFYIVNYNFIEATLLIAIASFPKNYLYGIQRQFA